MPDYNEAINPSEAMALALAQARASLDDDVGGPFGAVVVRDGRLVGIGRNRVLADRDPTAHAEVVALRDAADRLGTHVLEDCVLYTSCEPCPMCLAAAYWSRVTAIRFSASRFDAAAVGFDDQWIYDEVPKALEDRRLEIQAFGTDEASEIMRAWGARPDRRLY